MQVVQPLELVSNRYCELHNLIIGPPPRTAFRAVHCEIGISLVTRFVELGQLSTICFAQLSIFHATIDEPAKAIVQEGPIIASAFYGSADSRSLDDLLD